ncbi:hypothetical protein [Enterovirga sp. CN4-39]|uniref:hypothetical protein n=1 Tax=Enterovirga sp. CN4-39 TaxID=3400910 RepID=UPI003C021B66
MHNLIESARLLWCPGLSGLQGNPKGSLQDWLATATYAPVAAGPGLTLQGIEMRDFLSSLAADINRVSSAASESLCNINANDSVPKSVAWPFVKLYYSALFYAHCVLRIWGKSPSYLRTSDMIKLREILSIYGISPPFKLNTGQFIISADPASSTTTITPDPGSGGSHEAIWRAFNSGLADLTYRLADAPIVTKDKEALTASIARLSSIMTNNGANISWLSFMRNNIQYRQAEGVWYPYPGRRLRTVDIESQITLLREGKLDIEVVLKATGDELSLFRSACLAVAIFGRGVISDLSQSSGPRGFLKYGQSRFEGSLIRALDS